MRSRVSVTLALGLAMAVLGGAAATGTPGDEPVTDTVHAPLVWLEGPFGRVAGGGMDAPAAMQPSADPLDTFVRGAPMMLEADVPFGDLIAVHVVARPLAGTDTEEQLSAGATTFDGPVGVGSHVLVATLETEPFGTTQHAWLVNVPDREGGPEALLEITAPQLELVADAGTRIGVPGDGCYLYLCADMGELPPPQTLEVIRVGVGETLALRTGDGSGLAGWNGRLTPLAGTQIDGVEAVGALTDTVESMVGLQGLEAPAPGEWRLEVRVVFDRERGHQWQSFRLDAR